MRAQLIHCPPLILQDNELCRLREPPEVTQLEGYRLASLLPSTALFPLMALQGEDAGGAWGAGALSSCGCRPRTSRYKIRSWVK